MKKCAACSRFERPPDRSMSPRIILFNFSGLAEFGSGSAMTKWPCKQTSVDKRPALARGHILSLTRFKALGSPWGQDAAFSSTSTPTPTSTLRTPCLLPTPRTFAKDSTPSCRTGVLQPTRMASQPSAPSLSAALSTDRPTLPSIDSRR